MTMQAWMLALYGIWTVWGAVWLLAWLWANRTTGTASGATQAPYRIINIVGWVALFGDRLLHSAQGRLYWQTILPPLWHTPALLGWVLVVAAATGMGFAIWSRLVLGRLWSAAVTRKVGHRIVDRGPYAIVRHPIYTGLLTGALALAVGKATPIALGGFGLMVVGYVLKARVEERFLARELGEADYAGYRTRVPMLMPFGPVEKL